MTQDEILDMWGRAGGGAIKNMPYTLVERFAKLVAKHTLMNIDPSKFMSWQEALEIGATKEREACAKICDEWANSLSGEPEMVEMAKEIRARSNA